MKRETMQAVAIAAGAAVGGHADAASVYEAILTQLNNSGVGGVVTATINDDRSMLTTQFSAVGLEADQPHVMHFHGRVSADGTPLDSMTPTTAADADGDGFVELLEAAPNYGPILVPITQSDGTPYVTPTGTLTFTQQIDLTSSASFADGFNADSLLPLDLREFVVHGLSVPAGVGAGTDGEVNGTGGYLPVLPVAAGEFRLIASSGDNGGPTNPIPSPSALVGGLALLGLTGGARMRRPASQR